MFSLSKIQAVSIIKINDIKIVHRCSVCGKRLDTFWDDDNELDGRWIALDVHFSEVFSAWVANPTKILCHWCFYNDEKVKTV